MSKNIIKRITQTLPFYYILWYHQREKTDSVIAVQTLFEEYRGETDHQYTTTSIKVTVMVMKRMIVGVHIDRCTV